MVLAIPGVGVLMQSRPSTQLPVNSLPCGETSYIGYKKVFPGSGWNGLTPSASSVRTGSTPKKGSWGKPGLREVFPELGKGVIIIPPVSAQNTNNDSDKQ